MLQGKIQCVIITLEINNKTCMFKLHVPFLLSKLRFYKIKKRVCYISLDTVGHPQGAYFYVIMNYAL